MSALKPQGKRAIRERPILGVLSLLANVLLEAILSRSGKIGNVGKSGAL